MSADSEFVAHLRELLPEPGGVSMRRMFGGHGVFRDGLMFGLIIDDTLYLKVDAETEERFAAAGMARFAYRRRGREATLRYRMAPPEALEDAECMARWAGLAQAAAVRAAAGGRRGRRREETQ